LHLNLLNMDLNSFTFYLFIQIIKTAKAHSIWVPEVGTSRGHEPIIDQSCGAVILSLKELIEIYPPVTFPEPYNGSVTQLCPKYWPTSNRLHQAFLKKYVKIDNK